MSKDYRVSFIVTAEDEEKAIDEADVVVDTILINEGTLCEYISVKEVPVKVYVGIVLERGAIHDVYVSEDEETIDKIHNEWIENNSEEEEISKTMKSYGCNRDEAIEIIKENWDNGEREFHKTSVMMR